MFISSKRHRRELDLAADMARRSAEEILGCLDEGVCLVDEHDQIVGPVSRSFAAVFGRRELGSAGFSKLLTSVLPADTVAAALEHMKILRSTENVAQVRAANPLANVRARLLNPDGSFSARILSFSFRRSNLARSLIVVACDVTEREQQARELEELRSYSNTLSLCLASVIRLGAEQFGAFLQRTDAAMAMINMVLKKPARESGIFQEKLQEILAQIRRIADDARSSKLESIEKQARDFERSLETLCEREALSGTDFLPLAVELDHLSAQLALMRSLTTGGRAAPEPAVPAAKPAAAVGSMTENGTQIIAAPRFDSMPAADSHAFAAVQTAAAGSLESTLLALTDQYAHSAQRNVTLHCQGLELIPSSYQAMVKNISIQLIRNAVKHGIESAEERVAAGKLAFGQLSIEFRRLVDGRCEFSFEDDGRGLNAAGMRDSAVAHGLLSAEEAIRLPDRQAIKLLFKAGVTTRTEADPSDQRGLGMATVRRLVADANGKIALSTIPGQQTRFKISLPTLGSDQSQVA